MKKPISLLLFLSIFLLFLQSSSSQSVPLPFNASEECQVALIQMEQFTYPDTELMLVASGLDVQDLGKYAMCQDLPLAHYCLLTYTDDQLSAFFQLHTAVCVPQNCSADDLSTMTSSLANIFRFNFSYTASCAPKVLDTYNWEAIIVIIFLLILGGTAFIAGCVDLWLEAKENKEREANGFDGVVNGGEENTALLNINADQPKPKRRPMALNILLAWSPFFNIKKLMQPTAVPKFASINGLRCLSMFWVILSHTAYWAEWSIGYSNPLEVENKYVKTWTGQIILNGTYSVDPFFYMTGFLVTYLSLQELKKKGRMNMIMFYIHRYIRLTPAYFVALLVLWKVLPYMGQPSPFWHLTDDYVSRRSCDTHWWANLLYINNFVPKHYNDICMGWSWYMANDFQMYVLSPIFFYLLWKFPKIGLLAINIAMIGVFTSRGALTYKYDLTPWGEAENTSLYEDLVYSKFYTRAGPFLWGILFAFILHYQEKRSRDYEAANGRKRAPMSARDVWLLYIVAAFLLAVPVFVTTDIYKKYGRWNKASKLFYMTFARPLYGLGLAIMMHGCYVGQGWLVDRFLSLPIWTPIGRLTYSAYLYHPILMTIKYFSGDSFFLYSPNNVAIHFLGFNVAAFLVAFLSYLILERPLMNLEKLFLHKKK